MKTIFSEADNAYMLANYKTMSYKDIAERLGFTERQVRGHLNNMGYKKKTTHFNQNYFDCIDSAEKAYFLGLLFADGYVVYSPQNRTYEVSISLSEDDYDTLNAYTEAIAADHKPYYREREIEYNGYQYTTKEYIVRSYSKYFCESLMKLGVVPRKTYSPEFPNCTDYPAAFVRGFFDGDGCICNTDNSLILSFVNSNKDFLIYLQTIIKEHTGASGYIYTEKEWKHRLHYTRLADISAILKWLYTSDHAWRMERKYNKSKPLLGLAA